MMPAADYAPIAKANKVAVKDLQRWNGLNARSKLSLGQVLEIRGGSGGTGNAVATSKKSDIRQNVTYYRVKSGDSMYLIAQRFKVDVKHLQRWNPRSDSRALKPGQTLTLYLD